MPEISFALILDENLKRKELKVQQAEVVVEVTGDVDPVSLQMIRDAAPVKDCFQARRKNLNDMIAATATTLAKTKKKAEAEKLQGQFNQVFKSQIEQFQKQLEDRVAAFCKTSEQLKERHNTDKWTFKVTVTWSVFKIGDGLVSLWGSYGEGDIAGGLKGLFDVGRELIGTVGEVLQAWRSEADQRTRILAALKKLKDAQKSGGVPKALIEAAELAMAPYGGKLVGLEMAAKEHASKLEKLLAAAEKIPDSHKRKKTIEAQIDAQITGIVKFGEGIKKGRTLQQSAKDQIAHAVKKAQEKKDTSDHVKAVWAFCLKAYDYVNDLFDEMNSYSSVADRLKKETDDFVKGLSEGD